MVSLEVRGAWIDLLCAMMAAEPYGHLAVAGKPMSDEQAARLIGTDIGTYKGILAQIESAHISSRTPDGLLYSRRLVRDYESFMASSNAGRKGGGNPALRLSTPENTEARSQKPEAKAGLKEPLNPPLKVGKEKPKTFKHWDRADLQASVEAANTDNLLTAEEAGDFVDYWMEPTPTGRARMSLEKTWDTRRRMKTALKMVYESRRAGGVSSFRTSGQASGARRELYTAAPPGKYEAMFNNAGKGEG